MSAILPAEASAAICEHMNEDHADSIADYARRFACLDGVTAARMTGIDAEGMDLAVEMGDRTVAARVVFDHVLGDAADARDTLIAMARAAAAPQ